MNYLKRLATFQPRLRWLLSFALIGLVFLPSLSVALAQNPRTLVLQSAPKPLDPMTDGERAIAVQVAREAKEVKKALGGKEQTLIGVTLVTPKPAGDTSADETQVERLGEVVFYRDDLNQGVSVLVDLTQRVVREVRRMDGRSVPLAETEVVAAFKLALIDQRVRGLLGSSALLFQVPDQPLSDFRVEGVRVSSPLPKTRCYRRRCVALLFRQGQSYLRGFSVIVDLTRSIVYFDERGR